MSDPWRRRNFLRTLPSRICADGPAAALFLVIFCMTVAECLLIERKYGLFSAGFLQAHPITETSDRVCFLVFSVWMDFLFFGVLALLWNGLFSRLRVQPLWIGYHYFVCVGVVALITAGVKYQLLDYFSDTVSFSVLHDLGGNLATMLAYAAEKGTLLGLSALTLGILYLSGVLLIRRLLKRPVPAPVLTSTRHPWRARLCFAAGALVLTVIFHHYIRQSDKLYYGLKEKISYASIDKLLAALGRETEDDWIKVPSLTGPLGFTESESAISLPPLTLPSSSLSGERSAETSPQPKHLVLIVLESARAELIDKKVNGRLVAPNLREFADKGTCFRQAYCHQAFTIAARNALLTGSLSQPRKKRSIFSILKQNGYEVSVFSAMDESSGNCLEALAMEESCTAFFDARQAISERISAFTAAGSLAVDDQLVTRTALGHLANLNWKRPQFLYIKFNAGHYPYHHLGMPQFLDGSPIPKSKISRDNREWVADTCWNAQAYADAHCGELFRAMRELKVFDRTVIVVVGDHGESLYEDGVLGHGHALNDAQTRIPLIVNVPGIQAQEPIGQADVMDLLFRCAGLSTATVSGPLRLPNKAVFQYIGSLQSPVQIGMVESVGRRTILDMRTREVWFSDVGKWLSYKNLESDGERSQCIDKLVSEWRRLRTAKGDG